MPLVLFLAVASLTLFIINAAIKFIFDNCRVSEATLMGAEGITAFGSFTWNNLWLFYDCALVKLIPETVPQTIHKLI